MNIHPTEKTPPASGSAPTGGLDEKKKAQINKATREFESIFVGYLLKTMRSTVPKSDSEEGFGADILDGMFDVEMASHISRNGGLGIGKMLYRQMTERRLSAASSASSAVSDPAGTVKSLSSHPLLRAGVPSASAEKVSRQVRKFNDVIREAADRHALDANVLKAVIATESGGNATAVSKKDARGLMQLIDSTAADMGVQDSLNPRENVLGGAKYLRQLLDQFNGDLNLALAAYNAGPAAVIEHSGVPPFSETKDYVNKVMGYLHVFEREEQDDDSR